MAISTKIKERWTNYSLQIKLVIVFISTITLIVGINIVLFFNINIMIKKVDNIYISNVTLNQLSGALNDVQESMKEYLDTKSSDALEEYYISDQEYKNLLSHLNDKIYDDEMLLTEKNIREISYNYLKIVDRTITAKRGRDVEQYRAYYEEATEKYDKINMLIYSLNNEKFKNNNNNYYVLLTSLNYLELINIAMLIVAALIDIIIIVILTGTITRPLKELTIAAEKVAEGNFDITVPVHGSSDEVGILSNIFNHMIISIQNYIIQTKKSMELESALKERQLSMETHLKDAQLKYLQAQINPHFLFNTLNAGAQLAMLEGADKTTIFIENMADFFRYNLKKINEDTTLGEEVKLVDTYIYILNVRFGGEINYKKNIDETLAGIKVPSMILQPLVENAVNYGIRGLERPGIIELSIYKNENKIDISIWDNGNGMTEDGIKNALAGIAVEEHKSANSNGIGLKNVIERLELYFNKKDLLSIKSDGIDQGTEVLIEIEYQDLMDLA